MPEVVEDFFTHAAPVAGVHPRPVAPDGHVYRIGRVPRTLAPIGERLEPRFGRLGREYGKVVFDVEGVAIGFWMYWGIGD